MCLCAFLASFNSGLTVLYEVFLTGFLKFLTCVVAMQIEVELVNRRMYRYRRAEIQSAGEQMGFRQSHLAGGLPLPFNYKALS